jgi:hypothetical protein
MSAESGPPARKQVTPPQTYGLGPNIFPPDDHRHTAWVEADRIFSEINAHWQADLLKRAASASLEQLPEVFVEAMTMQFDLVAAVFVAGVTDYDGASACEAALREAADRTHAHFHNHLTHIGSRFIANRDLVAALKLRLSEGVARWTAEALSRARQAANTRAARAEVQPGAESENDTSIAATKPTFPRRAEWLQRQLDARKWTVHDLERFGGPNWKTGRNILRGHNVKDSVLAKLVQALSTTQRISLQDVPCE